jgi:hypothetical protein
MEISRKQRCPRRIFLVWAVIFLLFPLSSCSWFDKNVGEKVKKFNKGRLTVTSNPPGADVYVNDVFQGKSPVTLNFTYKLLDFTRGLQVTVQKKGYTPMRRVISVQETKVAFRMIRRR